MTRSLEEIIVENFISSIENDNSVEFAQTLLEEFKYFLKNKEIALKLFEISKAIVRKSSHENVLGTLASGIVEDLLRFDYPEIYNEIITLAQNNENWVFILENVWFKNSLSTKAIQIHFPQITILTESN